MEKTTKRLLVIVMTVILLAGLGVAGFVAASEPDASPVCFRQGDVNSDGAVTAADAIYLLYASFPMFQDEYPLNQDCDFSADDAISKADAIYLLYASTNVDPENYALQGMIHEYHTPVWSWDESARTATVTLKCGCGEEKVLGAAEGVAVTEDQSAAVAATCVTAGSVKLNATVTFEGEEYTATTTVVVEPTGLHDLQGVIPDCTTSAECANCDYEWVAPGHNLGEPRIIAASCAAEGSETYTCQNANCNYTEVVTLEKLPHTLQYHSEHLVSGETCKYVKQYTCVNTNCDYVVDGTAASDTYILHDFSKIEVTDATCVATGLKVYKCAKDGCTAQKETTAADTIPVNENHDWDATTGKCKRDGCNAKKVVATDNKVDASTLTEDSSLELKNQQGQSVALTMDEAAVNTVKDGQVENTTLQIKIETAGADAIANLTEEQKEQIGDNTVYDFSMVYVDSEGNQKGSVSQFNGGVTISLPYTLAEGENVDDIDVWYIKDDGTATSVLGTYSNGYVTFTVEHFSYYTVTKLTPAERCLRYGHITVQTTKAATCTEDGYDMVHCQRCGQITSKTVYAAPGHDYADPVITPATCTEAGSKTVACKAEGCNYKTVTNIPATGHKLVNNTEKTVPATCEAAGKLVKSCTNGDCNYETEELIKQLSHIYMSAPRKAATARSREMRRHLWVTIIRKRRPYGLGLRMITATGLQR